MTDKPITVELNNAELFRLKNGLKSGKDKRLCMNSPGLVEVQEKLQTEKQVMAGNSEHGYFKLDRDTF